MNTEPSGERTLGDAAAYSVTGTASSGGFFFLRFGRFQLAAEADARGTVSGSPPVQALKRYQDGFASRFAVSSPAERQNCRCRLRRSR